MSSEEKPGPADLGEDAWAALMRAEQAAVLARRQKVLAEDGEASTAEPGWPRVGLALSGGGVRSATFALGLLCGMARSGLLGRLDYLSTVSGGGYAGGMFGRLVSAYGLRRAQALLADRASPVLEWLRRNGRYLSPGGSRDYGIAIVTYMRALLAIHGEFMVACMLLGLVVVAPHLWQHTVHRLDFAQWPRWHTPWWIVAPAWWLCLGPGLISGYWAAHDVPDPDARGVRPHLREVLMLLAGTLAAGALLRVLVVQASAGVEAAGVGVMLLVALMSLVVGQLAVWWLVWSSTASHALTVARIRNRLTGALRDVTVVALGILALGLLDALSVWVEQELQAGNDLLRNSMALGAAVALSLRAVVPFLEQLATRAGGRPHEWLPRLVDVGGWVGLAFLTLLWLVAIQWLVFSGGDLQVLSGTASWQRAAGVATVWAVWVSLTAGNADMPNTSSLHSFYRARLARAYLAVGNLKRGLADHMGSYSDVTVVMAGDDTRLPSYHPETEGGPIHLINTTLNQTRDDQSGLYNADRKGTALTATWRGLELGPTQFVALQPWQDTGTVGRWVAVSGAAASPGSGAYTSRGLALLLYFLGGRLGYWMRAPYQCIALDWLTEAAWRWLPKPMMLASEAAAVYFGRDRPWWYLSDGGHFDNTGVYALLKREPDFIILSDAGCDPRFEFGDLENLVRKARIDFGADIDFYAPQDVRDRFGMKEGQLTILSLEDMATPGTHRGAMLARIRYRERPGPPDAQGQPTAPVRPEATLLVFKPHLHDALDLDLRAYARKHATFPHEPTSDQFFDEAQWESYHRLGEDLGDALSDAWLSALPGWRRL